MRSTEEKKVSICLRQTTVGYTRNRRSTRIHQKLIGILWAIGVTVQYSYGWRNRHLSIVCPAHDDEPVKQTKNKINLHTLIPRTTDVMFCFV